MESTYTRIRNSRRFHELTGLLLLVLALASFLSLASYQSSDGSWFHSPSEQTPARNWIGPIGALWAEALLQLFGVAALLLPFFIAIAGWYRLRPSKDDSWNPRQLLGYAALTFSLCTLLDLLFTPILYGGESFAYPGGYVGNRVARGLVALLAWTGALLVTVSGLLAVMILSSRQSFYRTAELGAEGLRRGAGWLREFWDTRQERRATEPPAPRPQKPAVPAASPTPARRPTIALKPTGEPGRQDPAPKPVVPRKVEPPTKKPSQSQQQTFPIAKGERGYSLPPVDLFNQPEQQKGESEAELLERAEQITQKFSEFSIDGSVVAIHPGPVVTTFEFKPDAGVKYSKLTGMTEDLSLALKAESVRIDRMAGRNTVGIEVPNRHQETIFPRDLLGSERFRESRSKLTLALGKDIHGEVQTAELDRMPHLLIAGATGAGKSVGLNGMIVSLLYKATPAELRFIMIDTKMIELGIYQGIPHLLIPVVTDPKNASASLQWAVREMEQRYKKLAAVGVRNIAQFNALIEEEPDRTMVDPKSGEASPLSSLPYIVVVIDEMADLMMVSAADVEESVMRLAQMARAVGIHLILATQRPSVDVITGTIKANFPCRIAFRVSQRVDSRTIIDRQGAEHLLGRGDMLMLPSGSSRVVRMHTGFFTEGEINRVTSYLKKMAEPIYDESVLQSEEDRRQGGQAGERDEMFADAVGVVIREGKCSITLIQRRLQLGYARAARIVDMMEQEGVVTPGEGSKPREVLVGAEYLDTLQS